MTGVAFDGGPEIEGKRLELLESRAHYLRDGHADGEHTV